MAGIDPQHWAPLPPLDPAAGTVIRSPLAVGEGYWAGAPGALYDASTGLFYLIYRLRRPRGVHPDRGAEVRLATSRDSLTFDDIWSGKKEALGTSSIERCAIRRLASDRWVLYVSYVDPADGRWRIDLVEADRPERFDLAQARPVLSAADIKAEGVKDPLVVQVAGLYHMIVSYAAAVGKASTEQLHSSHDAYNTGLVRSATGLATSDDGITWHWEGEIFGPGSSGWDRYCARISAVWRADGLWLALYDGSAHAEENYEERVGVAYSADLRTFYRATPRAPWLTAPHGPGALRYFDVVALPQAVYFYYEMARPDGSHDLRVWQQPT